MCPCQFNTLSITLSMYCYLFLIYLIFNLPHFPSFCLPLFFSFNPSLYLTTSRSFSLSLSLNLFLFPSLPLCLSVSVSVSVSRYLFQLSLSSHTFDKLTLPLCLCLYQFITKYVSLCVAIYLQSHRGRVYHDFDTEKKI